MEDRKIRLGGLHNTRDLGGIPAADGKVIKKRRLIRSGALYDISDADLKILTEEYGVRRVVDFRTPAEISDAPDPIVPAYSYEELSLLDDSFLGIARDGYSVNAWLNVFRDRSVDPDDVFASMYRRLLFSDHVKPLFRRFFSILKEADGAVLWHCSAGKDRAGIATVLVLSVLGASEEDIVRDYMLTGVYTASERESVLASASQLTTDPHMLRAVDTLMTVKEAFVRPLFREAETLYGGIPAYLFKAGILSPADAEFLREKYLES